MDWILASICLNQNILVADIIEVFGDAWLETSAGSVGVVLSLG